MLVEPSGCFWICKVIDRPYYVSRLQVVSDGPYHVSDFVETSKHVCSGAYYVSDFNIETHGYYYVGRLCGLFAVDLVMQLTLHCWTRHVIVYV